MNTNINPSDDILTELLANCTNECEFKNPINIDYTQEEADIINFLTKKTAKDGITELTKSEVEEYMKEAAMRFYLKYLNFEIYEDHISKFKLKNYTSTYPNPSIMTIEEINLDKKFNKIVIKGRTFQLL